MKRFALLFGALALSISVTGCGGNSSGSPDGKAVPRAEDSNLPKEVREFEAKREKALDERNAKVEAAKAARAAKKR